MLVLAIDTSGSGCFAAVYDGGAGELLACAGADIGRGHAERLMEFVDEALSASGRELGEIDRIAVTIGPGSFTGSVSALPLRAASRWRSESPRSGSPRFTSSPKARG